MFVTEAPAASSPPPPPARAPGEETEAFAAMPLDEVEREICELAAHIAAATCRWLSLAAEFDRRGGHEEFGFASCASWLAWRCSLTPRAAREQLRVARALRELPLIRAAFRSGSLSYSKVRALTRVAEPGMEEELLEIAANATAAQLERVLRGYRRAIGPDEAADIAARRHLVTRWEDDGSLTIRGSLPPEEAALFLRGLERARDELHGAAGATDDDPSAGGSNGRTPAVGGSATPPDRADALVALAESAVAHGIVAAGGGDRHQVVVHIDLDHLTARDATATATLADGVTLPAATARRLGCDAAIVTLLERDGEPLSVGRKTRSIPPALGRALRTRDRGCRFPGCGNERFVDAHHIEHWAHGGATALDNLVLLCRRHHRLVHEGGFTVALEAGEPVFRTPAGQVLEPAPPIAAGSIAGCTDAADVTVDAETIAPRCWGDRIDYDLAVLGLAARWEKSAQPVAERT